MKNKVEKTLTTILMLAPILMLVSILVGGLVNKSDTQYQCTDNQCTVKYFADSR